jgi:hypothetical protein
MTLVVNSSHNVYLCCSVMVGSFDRDFKHNDMNLKWSFRKVRFKESKRKICNIPYIRYMCIRSNFPALKSPKSRKSCHNNNVIWNPIENRKNPNKQQVDIYSFLYFSTMVQRSVWNYTDRLLHVKRNKNTWSLV